MESHVEAEHAQPAAAAATPTGGETDLEDFRYRYGSLLREMIRDEIERYLRGAAD
jgi:hypothetical protein